MVVISKYMKSLLVKLGKAVSIIKQDGLARGLSRVFKAFFLLFGKVGEGDILFVTGGAAGDSTRYRAWHVKEELELHNFKCSKTVQDNPFLPSYADKFKIFIFHRVLYTPGVAKLIDKIKSQNKRIVFDTDDLLFDPKYFSQSDYAKKINAFEKKYYENGLSSQILTDSYVKVCTTTTSFLADILKSYGKNVFIVRNKLSIKDLKIVEAIENLKLKIKNSDKVRIGYFSGTFSHNKDFASINGVLMRIMEKHPQVELVLVGPLNVESQLVQKWRDRIIQLPFVPRDRHFENISKVDINLSPLERDNPFCEAKSELKFFEAGILGIPTVAVKNRTFSEAINDGINGFLAENEEEWFSKLEKLILNKDLRKRMGEKAREKSLLDYTTKNSHNEEYYSYLRECITRKI